MTFGRSGTRTGMDDSIPEIREREGNGKNTFPKFRSGKGMRRSHSQNLGMGRDKKSIHKIREREGDEKMYSQNWGMGRE